MSEAVIETRREGAALVVTLARPKVRNAISLATMEALIGAMDAASAEDAVRAVIFTGGPDYFSAGADLNDALAIAGARAPDRPIAQSVKIRKSDISCPRVRMLSRYRVLFLTP